MNVKRCVSAVLLGGAVMGGPALVPGMADATTQAGITIQPVSIELTVVDDDGGGSTTSMKHFISQPAKTAGTQPAKWEFGGCSGRQNDGEVWVQTTVIATLTTSTSYKVHVHLDLYEDTSGTCGGLTLNYDFEDLDLDGWNDFDLTGNAPGGIGTSTLPVFYDGHATLDGGELKIGFQS